MLPFVLTSCMLMSTKMIPGGGGVPVGSGDRDHLGVIRDPWWEGDHVATANPFCLEFCLRGTCYLYMTSAKNK